MQWHRATVLHQCLSQTAAMLSLKRKWMWPSAFDLCSHCLMYVPRSPQVILMCKESENTVTFANVKIHFQFFSQISKFSCILCSVLSHGLISKYAVVLLLTIQFPFRSPRYRKGLVCVILHCSYDSYHIQEKRCVCGTDLSSVLGVLLLYFCVTPQPFCSGKQKTKTCLYHCHKSLVVHKTRFWSKS